ncbi:MAG: FHA domain-containing protein [bacterium]
MNARWLYFVMPMMGALAAVLAFMIASPYLATLDHRGIPLSDPSSHYTIGTAWDIVKHVALGGLLSGMFCFVLALKRGRPWSLALIGGLIGAVAVPIANSTSDVLGITLERNFGNRLPMLVTVIWCLLVPSTLATIQAVVMGSAPQRLSRTLTACFAGFFATFITNNFFGPILSIFVNHPTQIPGGGQGRMALVSDSVPMWQASDIAGGIVLGLAFALAENMIRSASLRMEVAGEEPVCWDLNKAINRIGTGEKAEVALPAGSGILSDHAYIVRHGNRFQLDDLGGGAKTLLNGSRMKAPAYLSEGDVITIGPTELVFTHGQLGSTFKKKPAQENQSAAA